ncbi:MAG: DUF1700 domain-containing protein [Lachnospiraceae bacterium]|nr:DUF1700 domain-containing protein [Lachnospiraceae bacterium]
MKKDEFKKIIEKNLSVLDDKEIKDIVSEYEQHINMKMEKGMSEEAAIEDFGDLTELTSGILEAYHLKGNLAEDTPSSTGEKSLLDSVSNISGEAGEMALSGAKNLLGFCKKIVVKILKAPGKVCNVVTDSFKDTEGKSGIGKIIYGIKKLFVSTIKFGIICIKKCFSLAITLCIKCFKLGIWLFKKCCKAIVALFGLTVAFLTLGCIFLVGLLFVLSILGYPLIGLLIASTGMILIGISIVMFCYGILFKRNAGKKNIVKSDLNDSDSNDSMIKESSNNFTDDDSIDFEDNIVKNIQEVIAHA